MPEPVLGPEAPPTKADARNEGIHVVLVSHYPPPNPGGIAFVAAELMRRLSARGHRVTMITSDVGIGVGTFQRDRTTHIAVRAINPLEKYDIPYPIFHPLELVRALRKVLATADLVHVHGMLYMSSAVAAAMAGRYGRPMVLTEHVGKIPYESGALDRVQQTAIDTLGRYCCGRARAVTFLNQRVARELQPLIRPDTEAVRIPNGVDTDFFRPAQGLERRALRRKWGFARPTALFVGRFVRRKGVDSLLAAANGHYDLVLCGGDSVNTDENPGARVLGALPQSALSELYRAADVLVLPSRGEGFPLVVQEAMASGLPAIVTDNDENREYLDESVARFSAPEPSALRENIRALLDAPALRECLGRAARQWALERFDWEHTTDRYLEIYRRLAT